MTTFGSQRAFAQACSKTDDWISKIILGIKNPNMEEKKLITEKLGVNYGDDLFINQTKDI